MNQQLLSPWSSDLDDQYELEVLTGEVIDEIHIESHSAGSLLSVNEVLNAFGSFRPFSVLFGICEDGLPLMLNLKDSTAGSLLIEGNPRMGKPRF
jgi:hypothetical protein